MVNAASIASAERSSSRVHSCKPSSLVTKAFSALSQSLTRASVTSQSTVVL